MSQARLIMFKRVDNGQTLIIPDCQIRSIETTNDKKQLVVNDILVHVEDDLKMTLYFIYSAAEKLNMSK